VKQAAADRTMEALCGLIESHGDRLVVMSGMAEGFDSCMAWTAIRAGIRLWCAVPTRSYGGYYWGRASLTGQDRLAEFWSILRQAWKVTYVMEEIHGVDSLYLNGEHANNVRNRFMVEQADEFVAWDVRPGSGTAHCVEQARLAGVPCLDLSAAEALPLA
jgi:hypothetical protein